MKIVFGARTRCGGQFLINMTSALLGNLLEPLSSITSGRFETMLNDKKEQFRELYLQGYSWKYFQKHSISSVKLEDPAIDFVGYSIATQYPKAKWLTTLRRIEDVITSHFNIKSWGKSEEHVLRSFLFGIDLFERLAEEKRLFVINIDAPEKFDIHNMAKFLNCNITIKAQWIVSNWPKINTLKYQKEKFGENAREKEIPPTLESLRDRHPWIDGIENRYLRLWESCS